MTLTLTLTRQVTLAVRKISMQAQVANMVGTSGINVDVDWKGMSK
jgi:hypothetical protein